MFTIYIASHVEFSLKKTCVCAVLQVFLCSFGHPNNSWSIEWISPSPSITVLLWTLSRGKILKNTLVKKLNLHYQDFLIKR